MSYLRYVAAMTVLTTGILVGCTSTESTTREEDEEEPVGTADQALGETTCTTATPYTSVNVGGSAGSYHVTSGASYNPTDCPYQFIAQFTPSSGGTFGSGAFYNGYADTPLNLVSSTVCQSYNQYYEVWELISGTWTERGYTWLKGYHTNGDVKNCYWSTYSSSGPDFSANPAVTSSATKVRIVVSRWSESGTKGADVGDTFHSVYAGIGR